MARFTSFFIRKSGTKVNGYENAVKIGMKRKEVTLRVGATQRAFAIWQAAWHVPMVYLFFVFVHIFTASSLRCSLCSVGHKWKNCTDPTSLRCANCNGPSSATDRLCRSLWQQLVEALLSWRGTLMTKDRACCPGRIRDTVREMPAILYRRQHIVWVSLAITPRRM